MSYSEHFYAVDEAVGPQPWMQMRRVATVTAPAVAKSYDPSDGWSKSELLQTVDVEWTNNSPISQWVYGLVSKDGCQVALQCRSRGYLATRHGMVVDTPFSAIDMIEVSRFGVGSDLGNGGLLSLGGAYAISELRQNSSTIPLMPHVTGWTLLGPGQVLRARVQVGFVSEFWENTQIDGGDGDTESRITAGEIRVDLFAVPAMAAIGQRNVPTLVGGNSNVKHDVKITSSTVVDKPSGLSNGDVLVAVVVNQWGLSTDINPVEPGWTLLHSRNDGIAGWEDVHLKVYVRTIVGGEPSTFSFTNGFLAQEIAVILPLRNVVPHGVTTGEVWYAGSTLTRYRRLKEHSAPSINRRGQLLLSMSYFAHSPTQGAVTQGAPAGMTSVKDVAASASSLGIAMLGSPPVPTLERKFTASATPQIVGRAISASILIPGTQT